MTKKTAFTLLFLAGLLAGGFLPCPAQSAEPPLTLERAVGIALEKNLDVTSAREELAKAKGYLVYARSGLFPSISVNGTLSRRNDDSSKLEEENAASVGLSQYLYAGGVISAGYEQARQGLVKAERDVRDVEERVALAVYDAFCTVLVRKADAETARDALAYYENYAKDLGKRFELGLARKLDYSRALQQRESASAEYTGAKNALSTARIGLFTLLRMPPDSGTEIVGDLETAPVSVNGGESVGRGLAERPDLQSLKSAAIIQEAAVKIAGAGRRPGVTLSASKQLAYDSDPYSSAEDDDWLAMISVMVPVFDGGATKGKVMREKAVLNQVEQAVSKKEEAVGAEVHQAVLALESAHEMVGAARKSLELAKENLRLAEVGYREGVNTQLDLLSARSSLTANRLLLAGTLKSYRISLANLWKAEGALVKRVLDR